MPRNPGCRECPLFANSTTVCLWGQGAKGYGMVVGMNPGEKEDGRGLPFIGPSGKKLDELLKAAGLDRSKLYITNAVKCRTEGNQEPSTDAMNACRHYLKEEIDAVRPKAILALGNTALRTLVGKSGVASLRNQELPLRSEYKMDTGVVFATYHPAALLRDDGHYPDTLSDLRRFKRFLDGAGDEDLPPIQVHDKEGEAPDWEDATVAYDIETNFAPEINGQPQMSRLTPADIHMVQAFDGKVAHVFEGAAIPAAIESLRGQHLVGFNSAKFDDPLTGLVSDDAMLPPYLLNEDGRHYLEAMAIQYLGVRPWKHLMKEGRAEESASKMREYGAKDVIYTLRLWETAWDLLDPTSRRLYEELLLPASRAFAKVERRGVYLDPKAILKAKEHYTATAEHHEARLKRLSENPDFKVGSPDQIGKLLYKKLGYPCDEWTKKGQAATGENVLKRLLPHDKAGAVESILKVRHARKMISTYLDGFAQYLGPDGRVHPSYYVVTGAHKNGRGGTVTGRSSSSDPPIQTIPREPMVRRIIAAPPGRLLVSADFSQIEARIACWIAGEQNMLAAFQQGQDIHTEMARYILKRNGIDREPTKEERSRAKPPNYMFLYGAMPDKYKKIMLEDYDIDIPFSKAYEDWKAFHSRWPGFGPWWKRVSDTLKRDGQVTTPFGRTRHLRDIHSPDNAKRAAALRAGVNFLVQSTASDYAFLGLILLDAHRFEIVAFAHDSYLVEIPANNQADRAAEEVKTLLEDALPQEVKVRFGFEIPVPIPVDVSISKNWGE